MAESADRFAQLLTEAIYQIRLREHKNISIVQDEVGYAIGRDGGSPIEYWRKGHIPKERSEIEALVKVMTERSDVDEEWLADFLDAAGYISPQPLINHYFPDLMATRVSSEGPVPVREISRPKSTLPLAPTPFLGRTVELDAICELIIGQDCRCVTIIGPGGIGKTRLVAEVGRRLEGNDYFQDGVVYVPLASLNSIYEVPGVLCTALDLQLSGSQTARSQITGYLQTQNLLLILDNFELLIDPGSELVADLLSQAPRVSVLITSRERLNLQWEQLYPLDGLMSQGASRGGGSDAADLFLGCVERANPSYQLTPIDQEAINKICQMVAGFPLALELAASWTTVLSVPEIAAEISSGMDLLETARADMPERHRSLRAVCAYSVGALDKVDADIFHRLAIFRGGFSREAAHEIAGADLMALSRLLDKSLVRLIGRNRYDLHQILRQYGVEKLLADPAEHRRVSQAHAEYYNRALVKIAPDMGSFDHMALLKDVGDDFENVRQMWHWILAEKQIDLIEKAADGMMLYFHMSGRFQEGVTEFELALENVPANSITQVRLLNRLGLMQMRLNSGREAYRSLTAAVKISRAIGDDSEIPMANNFLANIYSTQGNHEAALAVLQENLAIEANRTNPVFESSTLNNLGTIYGRTGRYDEALKVLEQSETILRDLVGQAWGLALFYQIHGEIAHHAGDYLGAERYFLVAIETYDELGFKVGACQAMIQLAESLLKDKRPVEASAEFQQALELANQIHAIQLMLRAVIGLAQVPPLRHNKDMVYEIASLVSVHSSAEDEVRQIGIELLDGRPRFPYSRSHGEWLVDVVNRIQ
ncbi:MAG: tetratricopeptide repeat protein [Anaerolineae bacterium]